MIASALVVAAGTTALIGQIPLEELDLIVDPKSRELRVNPASPDGRSSMRCGARRSLMKA